VGLQDDILGRGAHEQLADLGPSLDPDNDFFDIVFGRELNEIFSGRKPADQKMGFTWHLFILADRAHLFQGRLSVSDLPLLAIGSFAQGSGDMHLATEHPGVNGGKGHGGSGDVRSVVSNQNFHGAPFQQYNFSDDPRMCRRADDFPFSGRRRWDSITNCITVPSTPAAGGSNVGQCTALPGAGFAPSDADAIFPLIYKGVFCMNNSRAGRIRFDEAAEIHAAKGNS
jgi:hypothetical protein